MAYTSEDVRNLPLPGLAMSLLATLSGSDPVNANNLLRGAEQMFATSDEPDAPQLLTRLADGWAWLEAHALLAPHPQNTSSEWQRVTQTGRELASDPDAISKTWAADRLAGPLDPSLASARSNFALGDYETASFAALKAVEVQVRTVSGLPNEFVGTKLMRAAFSPKDGVLTDSGAEGGEQQATADLFAGAMGTFKNPASHRTVQFDDAVEAAEVIQLADLLLRIVRRAERRFAGPA